MSGVGVRVMRDDNNANDNDNDNDNDRTDNDDANDNDNDDDDDNDDEASNNVDNESGDASRMLKAVKFHCDSIKNEKNNFVSCMFVYVVICNGWRVVGTGS